MLSLKTAQEHPWKRNLELEQQRQRARYPIPVIPFEARPRTLSQQDCVFCGSEQMFIWTNELGEKNVEVPHVAFYCPHINCRSDFETDFNGTVIDIFEDIVEVQAWVDREMELQGWR